MSRKTYEIDKIRSIANTLLALPDANFDGTPEENRARRIGVLTLLEAVLFATDNYKGARLLRSEYLPAEEQTLENVLVPDHDDTRRHYH